MTIAVEHEILIDLADDCLCSNKCPYIILEHNVNGNRFCNLFNRLLDACDDFTERCNQCLKSKVIKWQ